MQAIMKSYRCALVLLLFVYRLRFKFRVSLTLDLHLRLLAVSCLVRSLSLVANKTAYFFSQLKAN